MTSNFAPRQSNSTYTHIYSDYNKYFCSCFDVQNRLYSQVIRMKFGWGELYRILR